MAKASISKAEQYDIGVVGMMETDSLVGNA